MPTSKIGLFYSRIFHFFCSNHFNLIGRMLVWSRFNIRFHINFRQLSGGDYFVSVVQVKNSLRLQRLKLFSKFESATFAHSVRECCSLEIS